MANRVAMVMKPCTENGGRETESRKYGLADTYKKSRVINSQK
jgi:hypothetical protein